MGRPGRHAPIFNFAERHIFLVVVSNFESPDKGGSRYKNLCMTRFLGFLIRYFSNYYTLHRSDLAARAAPLDPRLQCGMRIPRPEFKS